MDNLIQHINRKMNKRRGEYYYLLTMIRYKRRILGYSSKPDLVYASSVGLLHVYIKPKHRF